MMTAFVLDVRPGYCGLCGVEAELYTLHANPREVRLLPNPPNVAAGVCLGCWGKALRAIEQRIVRTSIRLHRESVTL